jgi:inhibitor of cysteine peptidase
MAVVILAWSGAFAAAAEPKADAKEPAEAQAKAYPPLVLTEAATGQTLTAVAGRKIEIRLAGNPTTGYSWAVAELTPGPVAQVGKVEYTADKKPAGIVGAGGTNVLVFVGVAPGKANLKLEYRRPWEKDAPAAKTFLVGFDIKADPAPDRAKELRGGLDTFFLELRYWGDQDKPFYNAILQVGELQGEYPPFVEAARVSKEQAAKIVDLLADDGFLAMAEKTPTAGMPTPTGPCYILTVREKATGEFWQSLGWDGAMLRRLDALRPAVDGDAAKSLDTLLGRMSGLRKAWTPDATAPASPAAKPKGP